MKTNKLIVVGLLAAGAVYLFKQAQVQQQLAAPAASGAQVVPPGLPNAFGH